MNTEKETQNTNVNDKPVKNSSKQPKQKKVKVVEEVKTVDEVTELVDKSTKEKKERKPRKKKDDGLPPMFSFKGLTKIVKVCKVYDGDTITGIFELEGTQYRFNFRLNGYDAAEKKISSVVKKSLSPEQLSYLQDKSKEAQKYLEDRLLDKTINIKCDEFDKYGRILCDITLEGEETSLNE